MIKKAGFFVFSSLVTFSILTPQVSADVRNYGSWNEGDGTVDGSYSPYNGDAYVDSVARSTGQELIEVRTYNIRYDTSAESSINNYYQTENAYPGMDITDNYDNLDYSGYWASNYPDDKFDTDNDDGSPQVEETEVTSLDPYAIEPGIDYYFYVNFNNGGPYRNGGGDGTLQVTAHESVPDPFNVEYNTTAYDPLEVLSYYNQ